MVHGPRLADHREQGDVVAPCGHFGTHLPGGHRHYGNVGDPQQLDALEWENPQSINGVS